MSQPVSAQSSKAARPIQIIAHRGVVTHADLSQIGPENTYPAFAQAAKYGTAVELDVMTTRDGKVIVHHDFKTGRVFRLPGKQRSIFWTRFADLQKASFNDESLRQFLTQRGLTLADTHSLPQFDALHIASLEDTLKQFPDTQFYIELKTRVPFFTRALEAKVVKLIQERNLQERAKVASFSPVSLWRVKRQDPNIETALNCVIPSWLQKREWLLKPFVKLYAKKLLGVKAIHPDYQSTSPALVKMAHEAGLAVRPWVWKELRQQEVEAFPKLKAMGVDGLITNAVDLLAQSDAMAECDSVNKPDVMDVFHQGI